MLKRVAGKVKRAWRTPTKWFPIPIALGALVLVAVQYRKQRKEPEVVSQREGGAVLKPSIDGPWQVSDPSRSYDCGVLRSLLSPPSLPPYQLVHRHHHPCIATHTPTPAPTRRARC